MTSERIEWELRGVKFYTRRPLVTRENTKLWGYPVYQENLLLKEWNESILNSTPGYFIAIRQKGDTIEIVNDILGGYRLYYTKINNQWFFSDDYQYLLDSLKCQPSIDKQQLCYWKNHRYTLASGTLFKEIKKLLPASHLTINADTIAIESYFKDYSNRPCYKSIIRNGYSIIAGQLQKVYNDNPLSKFLLFYSGGSDSTFLLMMLKKLEIPFECVLIRYNPRWSVSEKEYCEAINKLKALGISDYRILDIDLNEALKNHVETAKKEMLFDRHISVHFYETYKRVAETWNDDVVIVNGQSADSILSFGPSDLIPGFFVKRCILYSNWLTNLILDPLIRVYLKDKFRMPWTERGKLRSMLDEWEYFFAIRKECSYLSLINDTLDEIELSGLKQFPSKRMYAKIISFLQGPDNQVVIRAANHFGIHKVIMPFTAPDFIYNVVKNKSNLREVFKGKYFVRDYNQKFFKLKQPPVETTFKMPEPDFDMHAYETKILSIYSDYINQIIKI